MANSERNEKEQKRIPLYMSQQLKNDIDVGEGFVGKWIWENEYDAHMAAGYIVVDDPNIKTHDGQVQLESRFGSAVTRVVNKSLSADDSRRINILVKIPKHLYEEDCKPERDKIKDWYKQIDSTGELTNKSFFGETTLSD